MLSYTNSMTAPIIPPSALQLGETDMQVTGLLSMFHIETHEFEKFQSNCLFLIKLHCLGPLCFS